MLVAGLATVAIAVVLWLFGHGMLLLTDLVRWWLLRPYLRARSEFERLEAMRAYTAWVRDMPPAPPRKRAGPVMVPTAVIPVIGGHAPFPGRRMAGG
jgi:hypothetical protein